MVRQPPYDQEIEAAVLGCVILDNRLAPVVCGDLEPDCFYLDRNRIIFGVMRELNSAAEPIDALTVGTRLSVADKERIGGAIYISTLADNVGTVQVVTRYIARLQELARHRAVISAAMEIVDDGFTVSDTADYVASARRSMCDAADETETSKIETVAEISGRVYDETLSKEPPKGLVKTGISAIDDRFGGLWPGVVTMLAARPSMGKSALALCILANAALAGRRCLFFSLEDVKGFVVRRLFARFADINSKKLTQRTLNFEEVKRLEKAKPIIDCLPLTIDDRSSYNVAQLQGKLMRQIDTVGVDLVVIDHLLKIKGEGNGRYEKITDAIEGLTRVLKDANIANLVLHQLNRENTKRESKVPTLSDLRGSGDIEQEIRVAWFLHRDAYYDENANEDHADLIVAKNSHGPTGAVPLQCDLSRMYFGDRMEEWNNPRKDQF